MTHTVRLHAPQKGLLMLNTGPAAGEREAAQNEIDIKVTSAAGGPNTTCVYTSTFQEPGGVDCTVKSAGDITIAYTLKADASAFS